MRVQNYACGKWVDGNGAWTELFDASTGEKIGEASSGGLDFAEMFRYARAKGNPALRKMTFHERARMIKALAIYLNERKEKYYPLSYKTGATKADSWYDIDGGLVNLFVYASKGRREFPDERFYIDGEIESLSKEGTFAGGHICVPLEGTAVHINAFNFPVWGMLEKIAVNFLAGMPAIVKPAAVTSFLTEAVVKDIIASNILPDGALQLICGSAKGIVEFADYQDVITFTGSAETGRKLKSHPNIINNSIRFNLEADSLNFAMLGPDAMPGTDEFTLFVKEVAREMTSKAGQKCTAIRRTIVPDVYVDDVIKAVSERLKKVKIGAAGNGDVMMGPLVSKGQLAEVTERIAELKHACEPVFGETHIYELYGGDKDKGAFISPTLLYCGKPFKYDEPHQIEAFGPVNSILPYANADEAAQLAKLGRGSLVGSLFTGDDNFAKEIVYETAASHGRLLLVNRNSAKESTGHGSPLPHLVHGGPGRAGGGEEMGGARGVMHYMQRTAVQGSPTTLSKVFNTYVTGGARREDVVHPFRKYFEELEIGDVLTTHKRTVTETDIVNFANISGDNFYAHMDITSLEGSLFERRVAHGYFIMSAAAGLFVDPKKGPVLANYGIDEFRFLKPVYVGDTIGVKLTVKEKTKKEKREGEPLNGVVKWLVEVFNQNDELAASGTILTLVRRKQEE